MAFKARTTKPEKGNPYYNTKSNGGYSNAIVGKPADKECNVLSNCVGYAYGRFNEIGAYGSCKFLAPVNAEKFILYKGSCIISQTPSLGACMVWQKGNTLDGADGAGHVAIVERIDSDTQVLTSESGWGSSNPFWTQTRKKGNGNWGTGAGYKFLGFIVNPAVANEPPKKSVEELANEVRAGKWGNGDERKQKLTAAGYDYSAVQKQVNELVAGDKPAPAPAPAKTISGGSKVKIKPGSKWYTGTKIPQWVINETWVVKSIKGDRVVLDKNSAGKHNINSPINVNNLTLV